MYRIATLCAVLFLSRAFGGGYSRLDATLINGIPVDPGSWPEVVSITVGTSGCTATVVGPRAILTAAHCARTGSTAKFKYKNRNYTATMTRSPIWPGKDQDVAVGIVTEGDMTDVTPMKIGGTAVVNGEITLLGYGCTTPAGTGGNDGVLRIGTSVIIGFSAYDMVSRTPNGAALCYGDSGGPAFSKVAGKYLVLGVNSKGNILDTNYNSRLDRADTLDFIKSVSQKSGNAIICGVTSDCAGQTPPPADPTCRLTANPSSLKLGGSLSLVLSSENAVSADIDGTVINVPSGEKRVTPGSTGTFNALATVRNAIGKTATCGASYLVTNDPIPGDKPTCTITAVPSVARVGDNISLEISGTGGVTYASIDGNAVSFPVGKFNVARQSKGDYSATGFVRGPGGSANCFTDYRVEDGTPPPQIAEFMVVPSFCGPNSLSASGVASACLATIKTDPSWTTTVAQVVLLTNNDKTQEVMPVLARTTLPSDTGSPETTEIIVNYGNQLVDGAPVTLLNTRTAKIKKLVSGDAPIFLEGRSAVRGRLYYVPTLSAFQVGQYMPRFPGAL